MAPEISFDAASKNTAKHNEIDLPAFPVFESIIKQINHAETLSNIFPYLLLCLFSSLAAGQG